jgi:hypothetical protein
MDTRVSALALRFEVTGPAPPEILRLDGMLGVVLVAGRNGI